MRILFGITVGSIVIREPCKGEIFPHNFLINTSKDYFCNYIRRSRSNCNSISLVSLGSAHRLIDLIIPLLLVIALPLRGIKSSECPCNCMGVYARITIGNISLHNKMLPEGFFDFPPFFLDLIFIIHDDHPSIGMLLHLQGIVFSSSDVVHFSPIVCNAENKIGIGFRVGNREDTRNFVKSSQLILDRVIPSIPLLPPCFLILKEARRMIGKGRRGQNRRNFILPLGLLRQIVVAQKCAQNESLIDSHVNLPCDPSTKAP